MSGYYKESVICENGHRVSYSHNSGETFEPYCSKCGAPTTNKCKECGAIIKGKYYSAGVLDLTTYNKPIPFYCTNCSKEYSWTSKIIENSNRILSMDHELTSKDKKELERDIPNLVKDSTDAKTSAYSFKEKMERAKPATIEMFKDIFSNVISDVLYKIMFP